MKRLLTVTILLFASLLYSQSKFDINNLIDRGGVMYAPNDEKPYTGDVFELYEDGKKKLDGNYRKGLMNGKWTYYHENGQIHGQGRFIDGDGGNISQLTKAPLNGRNGVWNFYYESGEKFGKAAYKNGVNVGLLTMWYKNGQKQTEATMKDGKPDGLTTGWYENGQKSGEGTYKDGKPDGSFTDWYENGQKKQEGNLKDGESDGLWTGWYENGQKKFKDIFKDGVIYGECWDEDGNEIDCDELE